ncbi:MAG TPA: type II secretion system protein GspM [Candidatus Acidoferrales bacterium]|nr:type II secretion system protein GspM [Candidatus Acidoferrales bacterium]
MNLDPRQLTAYFDRLAPRERLLLGLAVLSVVLIGGYTFLWDPLQSGAALLSRKITTREKDLTEMQRQHDHYLDLLRQLEANQWVFEVDPSFNLLGYLQNVVSQAVTREKITSLNPTTRPRAEAPEFVEELVEIKLTQLTLPQIVDLMYRVEKGDHPLRFSRVSIKKRFNDPHNFDVNAAVSVLKPAEKPAEKPATDKPAEHGGAA